MYYLELLKFSLIFFLPAYFANAMPVIASGLKIFPSLAKPINEKVFGKTKTYRGFVVGTGAAILIGAILNYLGIYYYFEYEVNIWVLAFLLGFGALLGDLIKSFIKRRIGKKSGEPWVIFDQIDYVIGALLLSSVIMTPPIEVIITLLIISPLLSLLANIIAYTLKIKKVWW
ncbi:CDP-2,3-bis-(O-geranylgeranyl)-sn-glycerol synthase [Patescibacteria group bacterium]